MALATTTEHIIALSGSGLTRQEAAKAVGCGREWVRQVTEKYHLVFKDGHHRRSPTLCSRCHGETGAKASPPVCGACRHEAAWIEVPCLTCGKPVRTKRQEINRRKKDGGIRWRRLFSQEHRTCQRNRTSPCLVCGKQFRITAQKAYAIRRKGRRVVCPRVDCRRTWQLQHLANMRAKRRALRKAALR